MQRSTMAVLVAVGASAAAFVTGTTIATSYRAEPPAAKIATVNIQEIFQNLQERKDKLDQLQVQAASLEGEFNAKNAQVADKRKKAEAITDPVAREAAIDAAIDEDVRIQIEIKKAKTKLERAQADTIRMIFDRIQTQATATADKAGFTMVMASDDWVTISPRATSQEATQVMSLKRLLYVDNKIHDITAGVLKQLNDTYASTKPPAPAGTGTGTTPAPAGASTPAAPKPAH